MKQSVSLSFESKACNLDAHTNAFSSASKPATAETDTFQIQAVSARESAQQVTESRGDKIVHDVNVLDFPHKGG